MTGPSAPAVETEGLTKFYGPIRGLEDLDLRVERGEIFGFLGPNGAGKTTTVRLLLGFLRPTRGQARLLGLDIERFAMEIRRRVGYLPAEMGFYDGLTGQAYLDYMARFKGNDVRPRQRSLVEALELERDLGRRIREYSRGMKQKLGLVQALQCEPELVIMDEPSVGLDPLMQLRLYDLLRAEARAGRTVFFSSHNLPEVERLCNRAGILREGRLVAVEDVQALRGVRVRIFHVLFAQDPPASLGLSGAVEAERRGRQVTYSVVGGEVDAFVKALAAYRVEELSSVEATLEEVFLRFYGEAADERQPAAL